jgi:hypothetical protein
VGTVLDLLTSQTALAGANVQRIQARFRWNVAKVTLARAIGVLDPDLVSATAAAAPPPPQSMPPQATPPAAPAAAIPPAAPRR